MQGEHRLLKYMNGAILLPYQKAMDIRLQDARIRGQSHVTAGVLQLFHSTCLACTVKGLSVKTIACSIVQLEGHCRLNEFQFFGKDVATGMSLPNCDRAKLNLRGTVLLKPPLTWNLPSSLCSAYNN